MERSRVPEGEDRRGAEPSVPSSTQSNIVLGKSTLRTFEPTHDLESQPPKHGLVGWFASISRKDSDRIGYVCAGAVTFGTGLAVSPMIEAAFGKGLGSAVLAYCAQVVSYWSVYFGASALKDRAEIVSGSKRQIASEISQRNKEGLVLMAATEVVYAPARILATAGLAHIPNVSVRLANVISQFSMGAAYGLYLHKIKDAIAERLTPKPKRLN